jgi:hypothetical protein
MDLNGSYIFEPDVPEAAGRGAATSTVIHVAWTTSAVAEIAEYLKQKGKHSLNS